MVLNYSIDDRRAPLGGGLTRRKTKEAKISKNPKKELKGYNSLMA